ncbi:hypothetical protein FISHEDRAFT_70360 [Fistulina hepatica ATCC 64428]|uniref:F-box domain-containing protein n=1 Tax=Fistulina hepatica ATCC 64428 TaxID=1128425 RepID=A0A0D7AJW2_9AGAR|nr:hypothetical protein FISHEDRAFT_70360 [Fistulina hepatica ATCC 64428]
MHGLKESLRNGFLPSSLTMKCIEPQIANLEATIKEVNDMLEGARAALVQGLNPVVEYLAIAHSVSSPIRRLPEELLSNVFSYLITSCSDENVLQDAMFEAGILGHRSSTIHRLASVCKYWWRVVRDTPMLYPVAYVSYGDNGVLAVRRYIEMTSPHALKFHLLNDFNRYRHTRRIEEIKYCAVLQELVNASSRWQTAGLTCLGPFSSDFVTGIAACICHSSYPMLKELYLRSFPMSQFFSQAQVPALRVLKIDWCQIELHAMQPILFQITDLDLRYLWATRNVDLDFHAILSYAPALSQLTVYSQEINLAGNISHTQADAPFILNIITAPSLVYLHLGDDPSRFNVVDTFLRRSRCNIESLHLDIWSSSGMGRMTSSITKLWYQMPHVTHLVVPAGQEIWVPFQECTPDGRFSVFPQLQHLEIDDNKEIRTPCFRVVSDMMRVILMRCGARKVRVKGCTGYRKSKKPPVLRRLDIRCVLTSLQHRTLLALSDCGALEVCCSVPGNPARHAYSDDDSGGSVSGEEDSCDDSDSEVEDCSGGDDNGVAYV